MYVDKYKQRNIYTLTVRGAFSANLVAIHIEFNNVTAYWPHKGLHWLLKYIGCLLLESITIPQFINKCSIFKVFTYSLFGSGF
jgi:hypothetical protein